MYPLIYAEQLNFYLAHTDSGQFGCMLLIIIGFFLGGGGGVIKKGYDIEFEIVRPINWCK